jgi:hypothetical protein
VCTVSLKAGLSIYKALQEIMTAAVSAEREGDDAKKLSKKDIESAIKIAIESASGA